MSNGLQRANREEKGAQGNTSASPRVGPGKRSRVQGRYGTQPGRQQSSSLSSTEAFGSQIGSGRGDASAGVGQSLVRGGASTFEDNELLDGMADTRHAIGSLESGSVEAEDHERNLTILQWEASERGMAELSPGADAATAVTLPSGLLVSASAAHLRYLVEDEIRRHGQPFGLLAQVDEALAEEKSVGEEMVEGGDASETAELGQWDRVDELQQIRSTLEAQITLVLEQNEAFKQQFKRHAYRTAWTILDDSEKRVRSEMERYGLDMVGAGGGSREPRTEPEDRAAMRGAASELSKSKRAFDALTEKRQALLDGFDSEEVDVTAPVGGKTARPRGQADYYMLAGVDAQLKKAKLDYVQKRVAADAKYPALARYSSAEELAAVASESDGPGRLWLSLDENLSNISKTRSALADGELDPLKLPQIVEMSKIALMVPGGSMKGRLVGDLVEEANEWEFRTIAITAIAIGLGLLAIPLSGGTSVGATVALATAEGVGVAVEVALIADSIGDYLTEKAAHGTDPDRMRALMREEPSIGWLLVEMLGGAAGVGSAIKAFRSVAAARRAALKAKTLDELKSRLDRARSVGEASGTPESALRRFERQVIEEHPDSELVEPLKKKAAWFSKDPVPDDLVAAMGESSYREALDMIGEFRADPKLGPHLAGHTDEELAAVIGYTDFDYAALNSALWKGNESELERLSSYLRYADDGLAKMPIYPGVVYRGVSLTPEQIRRYVPGKTVVEPALTSTAKSEGKAFGGNVRFIIESKTGRDVEAVSVFGDEEEVLFRAGTAFNVLDKIRDGDDVVIRMIEI